MMTTSFARAPSVPFLILVGLLAVVNDPAPAFAQDLPPAIQMDRYLLQAEEHIASGDYHAAIAALESVRTLGEESNLEIPHTFWFRDAQAALGAGLHARAETSAVRYLEVTGREGEHYTAALQILNRVERMAADAESRREAGCDGGWPGLVVSADIEVVKICLETGSDVNAPNESGIVALHWAAEAGSTELVETLIAAGADVNAPAPSGYGGYVALHWAAGRGHTEVAEILIEAGADVNARDRVTTTVSDGDSYEHRATPLLHAVEASNVEIVELLIEAGADVNATTDRRDGRSPLRAAVIEDDIRMAEILIGAGADVSYAPLGVPVLSATVHSPPYGDRPASDPANAIPLARMLIEAGADVNARMALGSVLQEVLSTYDLWRNQPPEREGRQEWVSTLSAIGDMLVSAGARCWFYPRHARCPNR